MPAPDPRFHPGDAASLTRVIGDAEVRAFAALTGDTNPVHLDEDYARGTRFGRRVAHGLLTLALVGAVLGTRLPGPGAIYLSQEVRFRRPVWIGDRVTARVEVMAFDTASGQLTVRTQCFRGDGERVLDGEARLLVPMTGGAA